ncbi:hypothetical protein CPB83DRAFT_761944 [Crepidotus variabilis]|uniref:Uncharacterized protein n=1 Tax=Crepidotus variabilis TaxID=179855 RepID=A0A9P6ELX7_9AGAR|nr:hypothetical protein CPB83DRAFT_761944 [Crepidotus variabilis]
MDASPQPSTSIGPAAEKTAVIPVIGPSSRFSRDRRQRTPQDKPPIQGQSQSQGQTSAPTTGPTPTQILFDITRQVVQILKEAGIGSALFGSLGTSLYGKQRSPNDIDLLTFPPPDQNSDPERIKQLIVTANPDKFYLRDSVNPSATYKILFYKLTRRQNPTRFFRRNSCKVDILIPGIMHLPSLHPNPERIIWIDGLPVLPFAVLLSQKLQAWDDHRNMSEETEPQKYAKRFVDKNDLGRMFKMEEHVRPLREASARPWNDRILFSEEFETLCWSRARDFCSIFPEFKARFLSIGLGEDTYDIFA